MPGCLLREHVFLIACELPCANVILAPGMLFMQPGNSGSTKAAPDGLKSSQQCEPSPLAPAMLCLLHNSCTELSSEGKAANSMAFTCL